jgi:Nucleotide modification associated domain 1
MNFQPSRSGIFASHKIIYVRQTMNTNQQYDTAIECCRDIFLKKTSDYGTSWRVYRTISVVDQIYIKAKRIRTIQENGGQRIGDDIPGEFKGILNYSIIGLIQLDLKTDETEELPLQQVESFYNEKVRIAKELMEDKNHDYGEAWRQMSQESFADLILAKLLRIKQILKNGGQSIMSEGIDANYYDIVNYAVFALILMEEGAGLKVDG